MIYPQKYFKYSCIILLIIVMASSIFFIFSTNDHNDNMYIAASQLNEELNIYTDFYFCQAPASLITNTIIFDLGNDFLSAKIFNLFLYVASLFLLVLLFKQASISWEYTLVATTLLAFSDYFASGFFGYGNYAMPLVLLIISYSLSNSSLKWRFLGIGITIAFAAMIKINYALFYFLFLFNAYQHKKLLTFTIGNLLVALLFFDFFTLLFSDFTSLYNQLVEFHYQTNAFRFADTNQHWLSVSKGLGKWLVSYSGLYKVILVFILLYYRKGLSKFDIAFLLLVFISVIIPKAIWANYTIQMEFFLIYFAFKQLYLNREVFIEKLESLKLDFLLNRAYITLFLSLFIAVGFFIHKSRFSLAAFDGNSDIVSINAKLKEKQDSSKPIITISGIFLSDITNVDKRSSMGAFLERLIIFEREKQFFASKKTGYALLHSIVFDSLDFECQYLTGYYGEEYSESKLEKRLIENGFMPISLGFFHKNEIKLWQFIPNYHSKKR